ncbi:TPA: hypothetical protein EYO12_00345 [Candidatus Saccharibacteria bacterium]|nr:hypothetical protein [Candidatus Saccharibacteria bacterium]HIO87544.1 hypothetical protein [Candidatus Saccharibacteria bacterium]
MNIREFASAKIKTLSAALLITTLLVGSFTVFAPYITTAQSVDELESQISKLEQEIAQSEKEADHFHAQAETLQEAIDELDDQIAEIEKQIELTNLRLKDLEQELEETRIELERQKDTLAISIREHYKTGEVTTIELIASSDSFAEFFNQKDYLDQLRESILTSSQEVARLEAELEKQHSQQEALLVTQKDQKKQQSDIKASKETLLKEYRGKEAEYKARAGELEKDKKEADKALNRRLAEIAAAQRNGTLVSLGRVQAGDFIGYVGNTGYSTSEHLHFEIVSGTTRLDPELIISSRGYTWPVPARTRVTQSFKGAAHDGIDIGTQYAKGIPAVAVANGEIITNGCVYYTNPKYNNYTIEILHDDGLISRYVHLDTRGDSRLSGCSRNYDPRIY